MQKIYSMEENKRYGIGYDTDELLWVVDRKDNEVYQIDYDTIKEYSGYINILNDLFICISQNEFLEIVNKYRRINISAKNAIILASRPYHKTTVTDNAHKYLLVYNGREQCLDLTLQRQSVYYDIQYANSLKLKLTGTITNGLGITECAFKPQSLSMECTNLKGSCVDIRGNTLSCNFTNVEVPQINIISEDKVECNFNRVQAGDLFFRGLEHRTKYVEGTLSDCEVKTLIIKDIVAFNVRVCNTNIERMHTSNARDIKFSLQNCHLGSLDLRECISYSFDNVTVGTVRVSHSVDCYEILSEAKNNLKINKLVIHSEGQQNIEAVEYIESGKLDWVFDTCTEVIADLEESDYERISNKLNG